MQHSSPRRMSTCARLTTCSFAPSRGRNSVCTVLAGKSRQEKEAKKQRRKAFLQKRREEAAWRAETQRPDHWFELRQDGLWQEHRSAPPGKAAGRAQRAAPSRTSSGYNPTAQELAAVAFKSMPAMPREWQEEEEEGAIAASGPQQQQRLQQHPLSPTAPGSDPLTRQQQEAPKDRQQQPEQQQQLQRQRPQEQQQHGEDETDGQGKRRVALPSQPWKQRRQFALWKQQQREQQQQRLQGDMERW